MRESSIIGSVQFSAAAVISPRCAFLAIHHFMSVPSGGLVHSGNQKHLECGRLPPAVL